MCKKKTIEEKAATRQHYRITHKEQISLAEKLYHEKYKEKLSKDARLWRKTHGYRVWASGVIYRHTKSGCTVNVSLDYLDKLAQNTPNCPLCGVELSWNQGTGRKTCPISPTLDRKNNELVLSEDNVWILCHKCNSSKGARTLQEFIDYCKHIVEVTKNDNYIG